MPKNNFYMFSNKQYKFSPASSIREGQKTKKPFEKRKAFEVVMSGFEPPTHGFSVRCSTN